MDPVFPEIFLFFAVPIWKSIKCEVYVLLTIIKAIWNTASEPSSPSTALYGCFVAKLFHSHSRFFVIIHAFYVHIHTFLYPHSRYICSHSRFLYSYSRYFVFIFTLFCFHIHAIIGNLHGSSNFFPPSLPFIFMLFSFIFARKRPFSFTSTFCSFSFRLHLYLFTDLCLASN